MKKEVIKVLDSFKKKILGAIEESDETNNKAELLVSELFSNISNLDGKNYDLNCKLDNFINWCSENEFWTYLGEDFSDNLRNFIEKMAVWYELRYPDYEINRLMFGSDQENISFNEEIFSNNQYVRDILDESCDIKYLDWAEFYNIDVFVNLLSSEEKHFLEKPKYRKIVWIDRSFRTTHLHLTKDGIVEMAEGMNLLPGNNKFDDNYFEGMHIKKVISLLKENNVYLLDDNELDMAVLNYENHKYFYNQLLNCVMYRIIERGTSGIGARRAYLFAKEFNCNKDIPMQYGIDLADYRLREFINLYLKDGGNKDLVCFVNYKKRASRYERLDTVTILELLKSDRYVYTQEENELHQRLVNSLVNRKEIVQDEIRQKRLIRKLEKSKRNREN